MRGVTGWPVHLMLNAKLEPFDAAGFLRPDELNRFLVLNANKFAETRGAADFTPPAAEAGAAPVDIEKVVDAIAKTYDPESAAFGGVPRRPRPMTVSFL